MPAPDHIYLDHNATTPMRAGVRAAASALFAQPFNPSSVHHHGRVAARLMNATRDDIKKAVGCNEVIFTSGGSEANNLMLNLLLHDISHRQQQPCQLIYFMGEHPAIQNFAQKHIVHHRNHVGQHGDNSAQNNHGDNSAQNNHGDKLDKLPPAIALPLTHDGVADIDQLEMMLKKIHPAPCLIALQLCNHETGVLQPIEKIVALANQHNGFVAADGVQFFAHRQCDMGVLGLGAATMAGHKLGGGHGAGAVMMMTLPDVQPILLGGGQERGYRPGTQNTIAIHAMGLALAESIQQQSAENKKYKIWRDRFEAEIKKIRPSVMVAGAAAMRLDHVSLLVDEKIPGQEMVVAMDDLGLSVSSGAACSSGKMSPSTSLAAMGYDKDKCKNTLRVSFGHDNNDDDVEKLLTAYQTIVERY